jgi:hypothetical protein
MLRKQKFLSLTAPDPGPTAGPERWHERVRATQEGGGGRIQGKNERKDQAKGRGIECQAVQSRNFNTDNRKAERRSHAPLLPYFFVHWHHAVPSACPPCRGPPAPGSRESRQRAVRWRAPQHGGFFRVRLSAAETHASVVGSKDGEPHACRVDAVRRRSGSGLLALMAEQTPSAPAHGLELAPDALAYRILVDAAWSATFNRGSRVPHVVFPTFGLCSVFLLCPPCAQILKIPGLFYCREVKP